MNPFTDEDLRVLKGMCESGNWPVGGKALLPLLARLEAAERYCETQDYKDRMKWKVSKGELTNKIRLADNRESLGEKP